MAVIVDREIAQVDAANNGGEGFFTRERIADGVDQLGPSIKTYAKIIVPPGTRMGYHQHNGDFEIYYVVKGQGIYNDNGVEVPAKPGDVFRCADGEFHAIQNTGEEDLEFIALIVATL